MDSVSAATNDDSATPINGIDAGAEVVIAPRANGAGQQEYNKHLDTERHPVTCFINRIKPHRRALTSDERLFRSGPGFPSLISGPVWRR